MKKHLIAIAALYVGFSGVAFAQTNQTAMSRILTNPRMPIGQDKSSGFSVTSALIGWIHETRAYARYEGVDLNGDACSFRYGTGASYDGAYVYDEISIPLQFDFGYALRFFREERSMLRGRAVKPDDTVLTFSGMRGRLFSHDRFELKLSAQDFHPISFKYMRGSSIQICIVDQTLFNPNDRTETSPPPTW